MNDPIYLDHNATTPLLPEVVEVMLPFLREHFGNPSSGHIYGRRARDAVEVARAQVASLIGASPAEIVFTSGGTESNNLAIRGAAGAHRGQKHIVTSVIEHPATTEPCRLLEDNGWEVTWLGVDENGRVRDAEARSAVTHRTMLVTLMHANNETGTLQPVSEIAATVREKAALLHTDAAQTVGKVPVKVDELGVDLLSIAGHKLYAPKGVGALYVRRETKLEPVLRGAGHEHGLRPGTENVASIAGFGAACEIANRDLENDSARVRAHRDELWSLLQARVPRIALNGHETLRLPNTLNVRFPGVRGSAILEHAHGIVASTGSACHEGGESASLVLRAMGLPDEMSLGSIRLSLGRRTTSEDVQRAADLLGQVWRHLAGNEQP